MRVAYISGPYRASSINGVYENIHAARKVAMEYWHKGYAVLCPHTNTALMDGEDTDRIFLDGDIELLRRCDVIIMLDGWENSEGAKRELDVARQYGLEVRYQHERKTTAL